MPTVFPKPYRLGQMELCMAHLHQPLPVCHGCDRPLCHVCRQRFDIEQEGAEYLRELARQDDGFLMFSSHIGCYEVAGYSLTPPGKRYNALVYGGEKDRIMEGRQEQFSEHNITMIPVKEDMSHLFKINEALVNHEIVSMPADRVMGSSKTIPTEFLGKTAHFPSGPFAVATMRNLEVLAINVIRISRKSTRSLWFPSPMTSKRPGNKRWSNLPRNMQKSWNVLCDNIQTNGTTFTISGQIKMQNHPLHDVIKIKT